MLESFVRSTVYCLLVVNLFLLILPPTQARGELIMPVPTEDKLVITFAEAIAHKEGFYTPGSLARRNNNPGNLRKWGNNPIVDGFVDFPSREEGFKALRHQVRKNLYERQLSMLEFFAGKEGVYAGYAPASDNNRPGKYAAFVKDFLEERGFGPISTLTVLAAWYPQEMNNDAEKEPEDVDFPAPEKEVSVLRSVAGLTNPGAEVCLNALTHQYYVRFIDVYGESHYLLVVDPLA